MQNYRETFEPGHYYHIYNRAVGSDKLFYLPKNYHYFFKILKEGPAKFFDIIAFCLLPNHFHLIIKTKEKFPKSPKTLSEAFRIMAISYSQAINKQEGRRGSLFMRPLKRKKIDNETYLRDLIIYVHLNPVSHNITEDFRSHKYSSFKYFANNEIRDSFVSELYYRLFDDVANYLFVHSERKEYNHIKNLLIED